MPGNRVFTGGFLAQGVSNADGFIIDRLDWLLNKQLTDNESSLVQVEALRRIGDKLLSESRTSPVVPFTNMD